MLIAQWGRVLCPRTQVACYDFLMPRESKAVRWMQPWLKRLDVFACIRTGDIAVLKRRFGVPAAKCHFVPFPIPADLEQVATEEGDYIYSAGWAHRDWDTLMRALATLPYQAVLSPGVELAVPPEAAARIRVLPMQNPAQGREWMAKARLAVLAFKNTELPSGPLVLLDAMAMGKPVVATSVNGTRDYVRDGETALLAAPGDSEALAMAIRRAMEDDTLRRDLGRAAQADVCERFTMSQFLHQIVALCAPPNRK